MGRTPICTGIARGWRALVIGLIIVESLLPYRLFAAVEASPSHTQSLFGNPVLDLIDPFELPERSPLSIHHELVDPDPFFLRSQGWEDQSLPPVAGSEISYVIAEGGLSVSIDGIRGTWKIRAPLVPLVVTADYLLLKASDPCLFAGKTGEGLFAISRDDFLSASVREKRLPVYFVPLPGNGWTGKASAVEAPEQGLVVLRAEDGDILPFEIEDLETLVKVGRANLVLTYVLATRSGDLGGMPPSLSTAGFGLVFTGFHGEKPSASLFSTSLSSQSVWKQLAKLAASTYAARFARADQWFSLSQVVEQLLPKLAHVGSIVGLLLAAAVVFKYTIYRSRFLEKEKKFHFWRQFFPRQSEAWKHNLTLFGYNVTLLATLPYVFSGNAIQFIADRYFPYLAAGENGIVRKLLSFFVGFSARTNKDLQVNDRVVKGALVTLGIDTLCTAYQLYAVVPQGLQALAKQVPSLEPRVQEILSKSNGAAASFALNETAYVGMSNATRGPADYASDIRQQAEQLAAGEVDEEMQNDPKHAGWEKERKRRIAERERKKFEDAGLVRPGVDEFLYDSQTVYTAIVSLFGYAPPAGWNDLAQRGTYTGADRYGLIVPALQRAKEAAKRMRQSFPGDPALDEATVLLESLCVDATYFQQYVRHPTRIGNELLNALTLKPFLQRLRRARTDLLLLTYADAMQSGTIRNLPESWHQNRSEGSAKIAALLFQNAFFSLVSGREGAEVSPADKEWARKESLQLLQVSYPYEHAEALAQTGDEGAARERLRNAHATECRLLQARVEYHRAEQVREAGGEYRDPVRGFFAKWQVRRARNQALKEFTRLNEKKFLFTEATPEEHLQFQRIHAEQMMRVMGMRPVYDTPETAGLQATVEHLAESRFVEYLADGKVGEFLEKHPDPSEFVDRMRAIFTAQAYLDITTKTTLVPASSPAQPGVLQGLRNCWLVRKLPAAAKWPFTMAARFFEAATHTDGHHLGLGNWIKRNVPLVQDLRLGLTRTLQMSAIYLSCVWGFNYLFWKIEMPWYMHASSFVFSYPFVVGPRLFLQRAFKNIGLKPTHDLWAMGLYAFVYSWATCLGYFPTQLFEPDTRSLVENVQGAVAKLTDKICGTAIASEKD